MNGSIRLSAEELNLLLQAAPQCRFARVGGICPGGERWQRLRAEVTSPGARRLRAVVRDRRQERFDEVDEANEDTLNRILWLAARGRDDTYPTRAILRQRR